VLGRADKSKTAEERGLKHLITAQYQTDVKADEESESSGLE